MIVDSSALMAILLKEPDNQVYRDALEVNENCRMSAAGYLESAIVIDSSKREDTRRTLDELIERANIKIEPVTEGQARLARQAYQLYGKGSGHKAQLNLAIVLPMRWRGKSVSLSCSKGRILARRILSRNLTILLIHGNLAVYSMECQSSPNSQRALTHPLHSGGTMSSSVFTLPAISFENGLQRYMNEIKKFPVLSQEEEYALSRRFLEQGDKGAAHQLVTSHLRLVAKIAMGYRGYGLPVADLIAEGNIGLMQAVKKFDPERGFRLSTYAMWWIKAAIQEFILHSWSLVKIGTTAAQKKLFFSLRKLKSRMQAYGEGDLSIENTTAIAEALNVSQTEVVNMNRRLSAADQSLNATLQTDTTEQWQDMLVDERPNQESILGDLQESKQQSLMLQNALSDLNARERAILSARRLQEEPATLEDLSQVYNISRERVRQIEVKAFEKLQNFFRPKKAA